MWKRLLPIRKGSKTLADVLFEIIQREGPPTLLALLKERAQRTGQMPQAVKSLTKEALASVTGFYDDIRRHGMRAASQNRIQNTVDNAIRTYGIARALPQAVKQSVQEAKGEFLSLRSPEQRAEYLVKLALYSGSYLAGFAMGIQIPSLDVNLRKGSSRLNTLTLYSVPKLSVELGVEWLRTMLTRAKADRRLGRKDLEQIEVLDRMLLNLSTGLDVGITSQRFTPRRFFRKKPVTVSIDDRAYQLVERLFSFLATKG